ncbi:RimK family alpha-L-glutamate ligase [Sphingomonas sp. BK345]|uniref:ATP-grasp domain-containing protein n=1 Tax=Sphingomonas sp. BK345 TaxID=2586980 RepID=UPI0016095CBE|nr:alpha-L-glutamate ligase [Sphingomonas sp. BK345]MBB3474077.1 glutathione synthase/RimK-type ligase-like ATP-grasp enzyme [Sphingomonas sp. BK345]
MTDLTILYEHPQWFRPLFAALDRRGIGYDAVHADGLAFDPAGAAPSPLVFNRIAMSSFLRAAEHPIFHAAAALAHWESRGARVLNGAGALAIDSSKARQLSLIAGLGLAIPATRVVHRAADLPAAAADLRFPIVVKANIGGSGAGIARYDDAEALAAAVAEGSVPDSIDRVLLAQEYAPLRGGTITRVETLGGRYLYAIAVDGGGGFDLCPADACAVPGRPSVTMTRVEPDAATIAAAEAIVQRAGIDVGGVELLVDDRDGTSRFYDINALSNFVADPLTVLGWDPHERLVDWLAERLLEARA